MRGTDLIAPLVKAVQEQQARIASQQAEIGALKAALAAREEETAQLNDLLNRVTRLEAAAGVERRQP